MNDPQQSPERPKGASRVPASAVPPAVRWSEGMLLSQHHMQSLSRRCETLLHYHAAAIQPFYWGVTRLKIDPNLLRDGAFQVTELEAVLPDGLVVSLDGAEGGLQTDLNKHEADLASGPMFVHLAVAADTPGRTNVSRYVDDRIDLDDEFSAGSSMPVEVMRPELRLLVVKPGDDVPRQFVHFPLAQVARRSQAYELTEYDPPRLRVERGSSVYAICEQVAGKLRMKARLVANTIDSRSAADPRLFETRAQVHSLTAELPRFEALYRSSAHPFTLYLSLCAIVGQTAILGSHLVPPQLPDYDHNAARDAFLRASQAVDTALSEGIVDHYVQYSFQSDGEAYRLPFQPEWRDHRLILAVKTPPAASDDDVSEWVMSSYIGGKGEIDSLLHARTLGIERQPLEPSSELLPARGTTLYSMSYDPTLLDPNDELVVHNPHSKSGRPQEMVLYVRRS